MDLLFFVSQIKTQTVAISSCHEDGHERKSKSQMLKDDRGSRFRPLSTREAGSLSPVVLSIVDRGRTLRLLGIKTERRRQSEVWAPAAVQYSAAPFGGARLQEKKIIIVRPWRRTWRRTITVCPQY